MELSAELSPGRIWAIQIFPGGRKRLTQAKPEWLHTHRQAIAKLQEGSSAIVLPADMIAVWKQFDVTRNSNIGATK